MKKWTSKLWAAMLAVVLVVTSLTPTALAASKEDSKSEGAALERFVLEDRTETILKAAKAMAVYRELEDSLKDEETSAEKEAVKDAIFHNYNEETDLSDYDISAKEMDKITEEVLEENSMEDSVDVTYETDAEGEVTTVSVDMDSVLVMAAEEAAATTLTQEQKDDIVARYAAYQQSMISIEGNDVQDLFGVQAPYFTSKDTAACPIGSLLSIAGIPNSVLEYGLEAIVSYGIMDYATITGILDLFTYANMFAVQMKGEEMGAAIEDALTEVYTSGADTTEEVLLVITNWLSQNCTFDMPYIMEMKSPVEDTTSEIAQDRQAIYDAMYQNIYQMVYDQVYEMVYAQVYDQVYNQVYQQVYNLTLVNGGSEADAKAAAEPKAIEQAEAYAPTEADTYAKGYAAQYMDAPTEDGSDNGATSAMTLATSIINLWEGNHVGVLTYGTAVCLGYSNAFTLLVQHAFPEVYREGGKQDGAWRPYEELNGGTKGSWEAMVDYVRISFDTEVTMFGVTQDDFTSDHYWNAVKVDGKWYYVDPCYVDVFVEVMARDRVETNGNINFLYFLFSHDTAEELYDGYYSLLDTAYAEVANDRTYEDAWFAFMKSPVYIANNYYYYLYDSTDMIEQNKNSDNTSQTSTEYKLVRTATNTGMKDTTYDDVLIDFTHAVETEGDNSNNNNNGYQEEQETYAQVYNPKTKAMEDDALVQELYEKHKSYQEDYPSLVITSAYYDGKVYFNLANCILTYDVSTGAVERVYEYNEVYGERDLQKAFGGMAFTTTTKANADVTVKNPPIAGFTVKDNTMYVDIATSLGFISGKDRDNMDDPSNYGYEFEETNYNQEYMYAMYLDGDNSQYEQYIDTDNDNDEFMWSANIVDEVNLNCSHSYGNVSVGETCTTAAFTERRCTSCGHVESSGMKKTTLSFNVVDTNGDKVNSTIESIETETLERNFSADAFSYDNAKAKVDAVLGADGYMAIELPETIEWNDTATATVVVEAEENQVEDLTKLDDVTLTVEFVHEHTDACHTKVDCGKEESEGTPEVEGHSHKTSCYISDTALCGIELSEEHPEHTTECYTSETPVCGIEESENIPAVEGHTHTDACHTVADCGITEGTIGTPETLTRKMPENATTYTFDGDEIASYIPAGYKVAETVTDATVSTGVATTKTVKVVADNATANLQVVFKAGNVELESVLLSSTSAEVNGATFTASQITAKIPEGYEATSTVSDVTVSLGTKKSITVDVQETRGTATLNIKVTGTDSPEALTKEGVKGKTVEFTKAEIEKAINLPSGYAITSIVSDRAVIYGESETINVTVASTAEAVEGHGHSYVEFKETYYTRQNEDDPESAFKTGTCYVCIDCKDSVDEKPADADMYTLSNKNITNHWTWAVDYSAASLYEIPTELYDVHLDCVWENTGLGSKRSVATVTGPEQSGSCTSGITYKYTAKTADGKTDVEENKVTYDNHLYSDSVISYNWSEDYSACTANYECIRCKATGSGNCTIESREVVASCVDDEATIYTAKITLAGVPYANQITVAGEGKASGHVFDEEYPDICKVCGWEKMESHVSLPSTIKVSYTGKASAAINGVKAETVVEGSTGSLSRTYYSDKACTKKVATSTGASKAGYAPTKMGVYYVKVTVKADKDYKAATSNVSKLVIAPKQTAISAYNTTSGIYLYWDKVSEATGYRIYRREHGGKYERVYSTSKNTTLKWTDKNAEVGTNYEYDVRPYYKTSGGTMIYAITRTDDAKKAARTKLTSTNTRSGLKLSWNKVYNATGYTVWRKASTADSFTKIATIKNGSTTTYYDKRATNGTKYTYYVRPTGNVTVRTNKATKLYLKATEISKLTSPSAGKIKVTWDKNAKAAGYQVRYSTSESFSSYKTVKVTSNSTLNTTISGLTKGKTYYVKVRSYKKSGDTTYYSAWTEVSSVKTKK